jgi:hypothetical protein
MKYKIQMQSISGWCDVKVSTCEVPEYVTEEFDSIEEAESELNELVIQLDDDAENYRIVTNDVLEECNIYEE